MIQKTFHLADYTEEKAQKILTEVAAMPAYQNAAQTLLLIFEQNWDVECIHAKTALAKNILKNIEIVGITHFDGLGPESKTNNSVFTFLIFEKPSFTVFRFPMEGKTDVEAGTVVRDTLQEIPNLRCVMTLIEKSKRDTGLLLEIAASDLPNVPMFGADAGIENVFGEAVDASYVFDAERCYRNTLLAIAFCGVNLHVKASYNFGWIPVGKQMTITKLKDSYTVEEIDNRPAAALYEKYLGIPYQNEKIRLAYGLPQQIFAQICDNAEEFREFDPQAMLMVICMNRMIFLRENEHLETDIYRSIVPEAAFLHGNSEIFRNNGAGGEMHSALIAVGFREGEEKSKVPVTEPQCPFTGGNQIIPLENRLMTFIRAVTGDLEEITGELLHLQHNLEDEVSKKTRENEGLSLHVVQTLAEAIDAKDTYTNGHSARVAAYSKEIARRAGYTEREQHLIYVMGILHDVGKIGVPDAVINKPGKLTDEEFAEIKKHPAMGAKILQNIKEMPRLSTGAHWHHERYDGKGYPDRLQGQNIPVEARIIGVADAYDAMTSNRSYRHSMAQAVVREQIEKGKGTQFDPVFADIMIQMIDEDKDYTMRED